LHLERPWSRIRRQARIESTKNAQGNLENDLRTTLRVESAGLGMVVHGCNSRYKNCDLRLAQREVQDLI
jgi:hypothetical protein